MYRLAIFLVLIIAQRALAKDPSTQDTPSRAPFLTGVEWLQGKAAPEFEAGKIYVIEFWATWCTPCIQAMPHLAKLQQTYASRGVQFIGIAGKESDDTVEKRRQAVIDFFEERNEAAGYTIAFDPEGKVYQAYDEIEAIRGIPVSFVINGRGEVSYQGHPMDLDLVVPLVLSGEFDPVTFAEEKAKSEERQSQLLREVEDALETGEDSRGLEILDELEKLSPLDKDFLDTRRVSFLVGMGRYNEANELVTSLLNSSNTPMLTTYSVQILYNERKLFEKILPSLRKKSYQKFKEEVDAFKNYIGEDGVSEAVLNAVAAIVGGMYKARYLEYEEAAPQKAAQYLLDSLTIIDANMGELKEQISYAESARSSLADELSKISARSNLGIDVPQPTPEVKAPENKKVICEGGVCRMVDEEPKDGDGNCSGGFS